MYLERLWLLSLHLIRCLFSSHARKPVMGKLQKGETGRAPGPSEVLSKAFPFYALSHRYSSCQLKSEDGKNFGLEKNFSTSKRHLATGLSIWKMKKKNPGTVGMEGTSSLRGMLKNHIPHLENEAKMNMALSSGEKRNQAHTECVDSGLLCVPTSLKSIWHIPINILKLSICVCVCLCVCVCVHVYETDIDRKGEIVSMCAWWCAYVYVLATTISNTLLDRILLRSVVLQCAVKRKV